MKFVCEYWNLLYEFVFLLLLESIGVDEKLAVNGTSNHLSKYKWILKTIKYKHSVKHT